MPGLVPGIHALVEKQDVDGRVKPGHDVEGLRPYEAETCYSAAARLFCAFLRRHSIAKSVDMMSPKVR